MYSIEYTNRFRKDLLRCKKQGKDLELLKSVIKQLDTDSKLHRKYRLLKLVEPYAGWWECHVQNDWLLVWCQYDYRLQMLMTNTGSHSELF